MKCISCGRETAKVGFQTCSNSRFDVCLLTHVKNIGKHSEIQQIARQVVESTPKPEPAPRDIPKLIGRLEIQAELIRERNKGMSDRELANTANVNVILDLCGAMQSAVLHQQLNASILTVNSDLLEALKRIMDGFDAGVWVRSTKDDADPQWAIKIVRHVQALGAAVGAIAKAEAQS